jgi:RHS repeat-associated protein
MAENAEGEVRYLLSDGLGSVRQAVDENAALVAYHEFDPYGNPVDNIDGEPYGYTGEWWESDVGLLHLRARWYLPGTGTFLSRDPWEGDELRPLSMNGWNYVEGNSINHTDPSGQIICRYGRDPVTGECKPASAQDGGVIPPVLLTTSVSGTNNPLEPLAQLLGLLAYWCYFNLLDNQNIDDFPDTRVDPEPTQTPKQGLYHYTPAENIPSIIATGLKPSIRVPDDPRSDAQWGDGQYFTDATPEEASTATRQQFSYALFQHPWKFGGRPPLSPIGWIEIDVEGLSVERKAALFGQRFPNRSIYLRLSIATLPVADRVIDTGIVTFQPGPSGSQ